MKANVSKENIDVYTQTPHRNMDEEVFVNYIKQQSGGDFKPQTMLSGIEWKDKVVIEFGCGAGAKLLKYGLKGAKIVGLDGSPAQIKRIHCHAELLDIKNCQFIEGYLEDAQKNLIEHHIPKADLVICSAVLHHVGEWENCIRDISFALKPGGYLYLTWGDWTIHVSGFNIKNQISYRLGKDAQSRVKIGKFLFGWWDKNRHVKGIYLDSFFADLYAAYYIPLSYRRVVNELEKNNLEVIQALPPHDVNQWFQQKQIDGTDSFKLNIITTLSKVFLMKTIFSLALRLRHYLVLGHGPRIISAKKLE